MLSNHKLQIGALTLIFLLAASPLFFSPFYKTHDGTMDLIRVAHYSLALKDGQFLPRWAGNLNFGYGSPIFNFFYPLTTIISAGLNFLGLPLEFVYKIVTFAAFLFAPFFFYFWLAPKHKTAALVGAVFYGLAPYHLLDLFVRGNTGETLAFVWIPVVFLAIDRRPMLVPIIFGLVILTHNILSVMFAPLFFLYAVVVAPKRLPGLILGLMLTTFFWLPAIVESKYLNSQVFTKHLFVANFPHLSQLIYSPWGFGPDVRKVGGLAPQIGPLGTVLAAASLYLFFKRRSFLAVIAILSVLGGLFFSLPVSTFFWQHLPLLSNFQFPWRFLALVSFGIALLVFELCRKIGKTLAFFLIAAMFLLSLPNLRIIPVSSRPDSFYYSYNQVPDYHGESATLWTAGYPDKPPSSPVQIISGRGQVSNLLRKTTLHTYTVETTSGVEVVDNTIYFPGWKVTVDNIDTSIQFQNQMYPGLITFPVKAGKHQIEVHFQNTIIRYVAETISVVTLLCIIVVSLWKRK